MANYNAMLDMLRAAAQGGSVQQSGQPATADGRHLPRPTFPDVGKIWDDIDEPPVTDFPTPQGTGDGTPKPARAEPYTPPPAPTDEWEGPVDELPRSFEWQGPPRDGSDVVAGRDPFIAPDGFDASSLGDPPTQQDPLALALAVPGSQPAAVADPEPVPSQSPATPPPANPLADAWKPPVDPSMNKPDPTDASALLARAGRIDTQDHDDLHATPQPMGPAPAATGPNALANLFMGPERSMLTNRPGVTDHQNPDGWGRTDVDTAGGQSFLDRGADHAPIDPALGQGWEAGKRFEDELLRRQANEANDPDPRTAGLLQWLRGDLDALSADPDPRQTAQVKGIRDAQAKGTEYNLPETRGIREDVNRTALEKLIMPEKVKGEYDLEKQRIASRGAVDAARSRSGSQQPKVVQVMDKQGIAHYYRNENAAPAISEGQDPVKDGMGLRAGGTGAEREAIVGRLSALDNIDDAIKQGDNLGWMGVGITGKLENYVHGKTGWGEAKEDNLRLIMQKVRSDIMFGAGGKALTPTEISVAAGYLFDIDQDPSVASDRLREIRKIWVRALGRSGGEYTPLEDPDQGQDRELSDDEVDRMNNATVP